jgi:hypothetical protein
MTSVESRGRVLFRALWLLVIVALLAVTALWVTDVSSLTTGTTGVPRSVAPVPRPSAGAFGAPAGSKIYTAEAPDALSVWQDQCLQALAAGSTFVVQDAATGKILHISDPADC